MAVKGIKQTKKNRQTKNEPQTNGKSKIRQIVETKTKEHTYTWEHTHIHTPTPAPKQTKESKVQDSELVSTRNQK